MPSSRFTGHDDFIFRNAGLALDEKTGLPQIEVVNRKRFRGALGLTIEYRPQKRQLQMSKVAMFVPCFVDQLLPQIALDTARVLERLGFEVTVPSKQTCCGQPAFNSGYWQLARPIAQRFVRIFALADAVVCPSGSCTAMVRCFYPELLAGTREFENAKSLGARAYEFSEFLARVAQVTDIGATFPHKVALHDACHALRELGIRDAPRQLLRSVRGLELVNLPRSEECCGFGGTFAANFATISAAMGAAKADNAETSGAEYLTSTDPSCLLHMDGILRRRRSAVRTIHLSGIMACTRPRSSQMETPK